MGRGTKKERAEYVSRRSRELAQSGEYKDWMSIELALRAEGFPEARQLLDSRFIRQELDEMCKWARESKEKKQKPS